MLKIINKYLIKLFFIKLLIVLSLFISFGILIEFISKIGNFNLFFFLLSFEKVFGFVFFITTSWLLISLQKTREFMALLTSSFSSFKANAVITCCIIFFCIVYIFIYDGILLKKLSTNNQNALSLSKIEIYNKEKLCDFEVILFDEIKYQNDEFDFEEADIINFQDCNLKSHTNLIQGSITKDDDKISIQTKQQNITLNYDFKIFKSYFEEQVKNKSFKSIIQKILLYKDFLKYNIQSRTLNIEIMDFVQNILSFFYMSLLSFIFFSKIPPRSEVLFKIFYSTLVASIIYILNMIVLSYIKQLSILNPIFIILPSFIIISIQIIILIYKKV